MAKQNTRRQQDKEEELNNWQKTKKQLSVLQHPRCSRNPTGAVTGAVLENKFSTGSWLRASHFNLDAIRQEAAVF